MKKTKAVGLFHKFRLLGYRSLFRFQRGRKKDISTADVFSAEVIDLMGEPTVTEFADFIGISQPNATYKINSLASKGYIKKYVPESDRRECRVTTGEQYLRLREEKRLSVENALLKLSERFTAAEIETAERVLDAMYEIMELEERNERSV